MRQSCRTLHTCTEDLTQKRNRRTNGASALNSNGAALRAVLGYWPDAKCALRSQKAKFCLGDCGSTIVDGH